MLKFPIIMLSLTPDNPLKEMNLSFLNQIILANSNPVAVLSFLANMNGRSKLKLGIYLGLHHVETPYPPEYLRQTFSQPFPWKMPQVAFCFWSLASNFFFHQASLLSSVIETGLRKNIKNFQYFSITTKLVFRTETRIYYKSRHDISPSFQGTRFH